MLPRPCATDRAPQILKIWCLKFFSSPFHLVIIISSFEHHMQNYPFNYYKSVRHTCICYIYCYDISMSWSIYNVCDSQLLSWGVFSQFAKNHNQHIAIKIGSINIWNSHTAQSLLLLVHCEEVQRFLFCLVLFLLPRVFFIVM